MKQVIPEGRGKEGDVLVSHPSLIRVKYKRTLNILVLCDSLCNSKSVKIKKKLLLFRSNYEFQQFSLFILYKVSRITLGHKIILLPFIQQLVHVESVFLAFNICNNSYKPFFRLCICKFQNLVFVSLSTCSFVVFPNSFHVTASNCT